MCTFVSKKKKQDVYVYFKRYLPGGGVYIRKRNSFCFWGGEAVIITKKAFEEICIVHMYIRLLNRRYCS